MVSAESKAPGDSADHRKFWSSFHLKQKKKTTREQLKPFLALFLPFRGKRTTELWLQSRKVLSKQNLCQLPSEFGTTQNKTTNLRATAASRGPCGGGAGAETTGR